MKKKHITKKDIEQDDVFVCENKIGTTEHMLTIGGTICKSICGVNKYTTPYQIYKNLIGEVAVNKDIAKQTSVLLGTYLEEPIIRIVFENQFLLSDAQLTKWKKCYQTDKQYSKQHTKDIVLSAHVDGWGVDVDNNKFLIEVKNYGTRAHDYYREVEATELIQTQHYMAILDVAYTILIVRIDNNLKLFKIVSDKTKQKEIIGKIEAFYNDFVIPKKTPSVQGDDYEFLKEEYNLKTEFPDLTVEEKETLHKAGANYIFHRKIEKEQAGLKLQCSADIMTLLKDAYRYESDTIKITRTVSNRKSVDVTKMKNDNIYDKYTKEIETSSLRVSEVKNKNMEVK